MRHWHHELEWGLSRFFAFLLSHSICLNFDLGVANAAAHDLRKRAASTDIWRYHQVSHRQKHPPILMAIIPRPNLQVRSNDYRQRDKRASLAHRDQLSGPAQM